MTILALQQQLGVLRQAGAHQFDPLRFHYMEALARRAAMQSDTVQHIVTGRLRAALADWSARYELAQAGRSAAPPVPAPAAATRPLADLLHCLAQHAAEPGEHGSTARSDLKSVRHFRDSWSRLSTDKQVRQSLNQAPQNAGPLNSHMLVLRSLGLMRSISPDYLNQFVSYIDTLLCLAQREAEPGASAASGAAPDTAKKPKARRSRA